MRCFCKRVAAVLAILLLTLCFRCVGEETAYEGPSLFTAKAEAAFWDGWFEETPAELSFDDMYAGSSSLGLELSDRLQGLAGKRVHMTGFMAPPLTPTIQFFVLTREPMAICPFCSTDADWPDNIVVVRVEEPVTALPYDRPIEVTGQLSLGTAVDEETGFDSLVRIAADSLQEAQ